MKRMSILFSLLVFVSSQLFAQIVEPVKWTFESKQDGTGATLIFKATIEEGWHLYDTQLPEGGPIKTTIHFSDSTLFDFDGGLTKDPQPTEVFDKTFNMKLGYFSKQAILTQKIKLKSSGKTEIKGFVEFMSCNDESCTPPTEVEFAFTLNSSDTKSEIASAVAPLEGNSSDKSTGNLLLFLFFSFLAGLAAILTPCVFPMIPMTVSFFMNSGESKIKSRLYAAFYGFSIIAIYTIVGTLVAVIFGPGAANWLSTHWIPNLIFFGVFMLFAFSFFGMFEIVLPSWLVNKSDKQVDKGGFMGSFFMALTLVLVSFSCTGPIVGAILVESAGGQVLKPIVGWVNTDADPFVYSNNLYILGKKEGPDYVGYRKMKFIEVTPTSYTMLIGNMDATLADTVVVTKNNSVNFVTYKVVGDIKPVVVEPDFTNWDIKFSTYFTVLYTDDGIPTDYIVRGTLINPKFTEVGKWYINSTLAPTDSAVRSVFNNLDATVIDSVTFTGNLDAIGHDWKAVKVDEASNTATYKADARIVYVIKKDDGTVYKLHFTSFYNYQGLVGYPKFEFAPIQ